jgi:hypothetical protein
MLFRTIIRIVKNTNQTILSTFDRCKIAVEHPGFAVLFLPTINMVKERISST